MPAVEFHTGLADPLAYACRLLRKAQRQGHRLLVTLPAQQLHALDGLLWTFEPLAFVPHVLLGPAAAPAPAIWARSPIWLCESAADLVSVIAGNAPPLVRDVPKLLVNCGAAAPAVPQEFERLIELVSDDADQALSLIHI
jgi:DNA polymerase-3 subunit chi